MGFKNPQTVKGILGISTQLADLYLQVKINGDMALLKAIEKLLYDAELEDPGKVFRSWEFIEKNTVGYEEFIERVKHFDVDALLPLPVCP
jgi:anaerobic selenocysteine-containing dehydrogenase